MLNFGAALITNTEATALGASLYFPSYSVG